LKIIIVGETGTISRIFRKYLNKIAGEHDVEEVWALGVPYVVSKE